MLRAPQAAVHRCCRRAAARLVLAPSCGLGETVEVYGVVVEELALFLRCRAFDDPVNDFDPLRIGPGEFGYMPVAAIHDAVEAEGLDRVGNVRLELLARPVLVIGFGGDTRNL